MPSILVSGLGYFLIMKPKCSNCQTKLFVKRIVYGLPSDEFDFERFHVGGCIPNEATFHCTKCGWEAVSTTEIDSGEI